MKYLGLCLAATLAWTGLASPAAATPPTPAEPLYRITTSRIAPTVDAVGGDYIYVSTKGDDKFHDPFSGASYDRKTCLGLGDHGSETNSGACGRLNPPRPDNSGDALRTVATAVAVAKPGDVIVVKAGTYHEQISYSVFSGSDYPIVLQAAPGEKVVLYGFLNMKNADNWRVRGFTIAYDKALSKNFSLVQFSGGSNWSLENNHITGGHGYGNVMVNKLSDSGSPKNFLIHGNCINTAVGPTGAAHGTVHNIYLQSTPSGYGLIDRNLLYGASRGADIKAGGASSSSDSPYNVDLYRNTLLQAASGLVIGLKAKAIITEKSLIALESGGQKYDAGVKTYQLDDPGSSALKDSAIFGFSPTTRFETGPIYLKRNSTTAMKIVGTGCTKRLDNVEQRLTYGHQSNR